MVPVKAIGERLSLSTVDIFVQLLNITTSSSLVIHQNTNISQVHPHEPMALSLLGERRTRKNQKTQLFLVFLQCISSDSHHIPAALHCSHLICTVTETHPVSVQSTRGPDIGSLYTYT